MLSNHWHRLQILAVVTVSYFLLTGLGLWTKDQVFVATCTAGIAFVIIPIFFRLGEGRWKQKLVAWGVHGFSNLLIRNVLVVAASWGVLFLSVKVLEASLSTRSDTPSTYIAGDSWHSGGTLHSASFDEWHQALPANQLATASDWVVAFIGEENAVSILNDELRERSEAVVACIDRKTENVPRPKRTRVGPNAALCMLQMDYPRAGS